MPAKKKNGQIYCCIQFHDLNKACPKDDSLVLLGIRGFSLWIVSVAKIRLSWTFSILKRLFS